MLEEELDEDVEALLLTDETELLDSDEELLKDIEEELTLELDREDAWLELLLESEELLDEEAVQSPPCFFRWSSLCAALRAL